MYPINQLELISHQSYNNFFLIAGPCVVEDESTVMQVAEHLKALSEKYHIPLIFKASYKKANRSKLSSFTGIGDKKALKILGTVRSAFKIPVITDIHKEEEANLAAQYVDILQIPAFLSRQTELLIAAAKTGKIINIKKGQFMAPGAMKFAADKVIDSGNSQILLTERGTMFGYQDLIVDYRGIKEMQTLGFPVVVDITHSLQQPNQAGGVSGGRPELIETIARAGIATGVEGIFMETHPNPALAKSDGANMLHLEKADELLRKLSLLKNTVNEIDRKQS